MTSALDQGHQARDAVAHDDVARGDFAMHESAIGRCRRGRGGRGETAQHVEQNAGETRKEADFLKSSDKGLPPARSGSKPRPSPSRRITIWRG